MSPTPTWTRRNFVSTLGLTGAAAALEPHLSASLTPAARPTKVAPHLAFVGHSSKDGESHIQTYRVENNIWHPVEQHRLPAKAPHALATHPKLAVLYVAHSVETHGNLPRGGVSAYAIKADGRHTLLSREPLALSATNPNHLAISPDGKTLLATSSSGGSYNFFSLTSDGCIQPTPYPLKQTGSGPHPLQATARPHSAAFARSGAAYATDFGADRLNHIAINNGVPTIASRLSFDPGSGPAHIAIHPSGKFLMVASILRPKLTIVPIDAASGQLETPTNHVAIDAPSVGPIAFSPEGGRFHTITNAKDGCLNLSTFRFSRATASLKLIRRAEHVTTAEPAQMTLAGGQLHLASRSGVYNLDARTGATLGELTSTSPRFWAVSIASMPLSRS